MIILLKLKTNYCSLIVVEVKTCKILIVIINTLIEKIYMQSFRKSNEL